MRNVFLFALPVLLAAAPQAKKIEWAEGFAGKWAPPEVNAKTFKTALDLIRPSDEELKFRKIGWRSDFAAAVEEAKALQRPILLWSDQGHPLGGDFYPSINTQVARMTVWNDDEVQALAREFVPATAEVWGLRTGKGTANDFFRKASDPLDPGRSHGLYLMGPEGENLGFQFISRPKPPVLELLKKGLARWAELVKEKKYKAKPVPALDLLQTWPAEAVEAGLLAAVNVRDFPRAGNPKAGKFEDGTPRWNQMRLALTKEEAAGLLPKGGASSAVPKEVLLKLARKTLVDGAKGNHAGFRKDDAMKKGLLTTTAVSSSGTQTTLKFEGELTYEEGTEGYDPAKHGKQLAVAGDHRWDVEGLTGFDCKLTGTGVYDAAAQRFLRFELLAYGMRKGGREKGDVEPAPMGVSFTIEGQTAKPKAKR